MVFFLEIEMVAKLAGKMAVMLDDEKAVEKAAEMVVSVVGD